jgi:hypothetical protein
MRGLGLQLLPATLVAVGAAAWAFAQYRQPGLALLLDAWRFCCG